MDGRYLPSAIIIVSIRIENAIANALINKTKFLKINLTIITTYE